MNFDSMLTMESLKAFAAFMHAADQQSYVAAGRILGVSPSAVSKSVSRLESRLGVRLLNRTTRSIGLTEEGAVFYERCRRVLDEVADAKAVMGNGVGGPRGRLKVSVPHVFGQHLLLPLLLEFTALFPEIELDIDFDDHVTDLISRGLDVAVRTGDLVDTRLIARRIGDQHFVVCGNDSYLTRHGVPTTPEDMHKHVCIHFKYPSSGRLAPWSFRAPYSTSRLSKSLVFNDTEAGLWAATHGLGLAHLPMYAAWPKIKAGELRPVLTDFMTPFGALWLVWPSNRQLSPKVRVFVDFVLAKVRGMPHALLAG